MKKVIMFLLLLGVVTLQSCDSLKYKKINLSKVEATKLIEKKLKKNWQPYTIYVHTIDTTGAPIETYQAVDPIVRDSALFAAEYTLDTDSISMDYYEKLKAECIDKRHSYVDIPSEHNKLFLNQIHITVVGTAQGDLSGTRAISNNEIVYQEKVDRIESGDMFPIWMAVIALVPLGYIALIIYALKN